MKEKMKLPPPPTTVPLKALFPPQGEASALRHTHTGSASAISTGLSLRQAAGELLGGSLSRAKPAVTNRGLCSSPALLCITAEKPAQTLAQKASTWTEAARRR